MTETELVKKVETEVEAMDTSEAPSEPPKPCKETTDKNEEPEKVMKEELPPEPEEDPILHYVDEYRNAVFFEVKDGDALRRRFNNDDDESVYELSIDEVKRLYADRKEEARLLEEGFDLTTKAFKASRTEAMKLGKLHDYRRTLIRAQFSLPDQRRIAIQAWFLPGETVADVKRLISEKFLDVEDFELFTTPPKTILKTVSTLLDLDLVPSALVHIDIKKSSGEMLLKQEILDKKSNFVGAKMAAKDAAIRRKQ